MMSLFFVLSCFLLAMVPTAFGSHETVPPPTSSLSIANILVDGDKSVTLKVTTITYISAKNSTTVVPILTLSTVVEEIAHESVAVLTVPVSPASETTSAPTPSVSTIPTPSSSSGSQRDAQNNTNGGTTHDEPSPITFASSEHNGAGEPTSRSQPEPGPVTVHPTVVLRTSASRTLSTSSTSFTGHDGEITVISTSNAQADTSSSISSTTSQDAPSAITNLLTMHRDNTTSTSSSTSTTSSTTKSADPSIIVVQPKESATPDVVVVQPKESSKLEPTTQFVTVVSTQSAKPDTVIVKSKEDTSVVTEVVKHTATAMVTVFSTKTSFLTSTVQAPQAPVVTVHVANPYPFGVGASHTPATYHEHDAADGDPGGLQWAPGVHTNPLDRSAQFTKAKPPTWPTWGAVAQIMGFVVPWVTGQPEEVKGTGAVATISPVMEEAFRAAETPVKAARTTPAVDVQAQATPTSSSTVEVISVVDLVSTARAQGAVDAQATTVDTSTTPVIETTFTVLATDDAQDKPSVHVRDWNAAERTRRVSPSNMFTTLYGTGKPSNPTNDPPITRAIRDFPFLGKTTLVGTRDPSALTHGNRIRENQDGMDTIQARNTFSTSTSTALPPVPDAETPSGLNLELKGSNMENKAKDENVYLLLKENSFWDFLKHVFCFIDVYCDDDATDAWKEKKKIWEGDWMVEPIAAATAKTAGPTPDPSSMAITSFASSSSATSTSTPASASFAPTLDQDPEPHAKRSNNTDNTDNIDTNEMGNMNVNVSHETEDFWDGVAEGANKFFDGVAEGASKFFCWLLPFTCHH